MQFINIIMNFLIDEDYKLRDYMLLVMIVAVTLQRISHLKLAESKNSVDDKIIHLLHNNQNTQRDGAKVLRIKY